MRVRYAEGCFPTRRGVPLPLGERSKEVAVPVPLPQIKIISGLKMRIFVHSPAHFGYLLLRCNTSRSRPLIKLNYGQGADHG